MIPISIIPARGGSKGIPHKNLMNFCGLPLLAWSICQSMFEGIQTFVSTEDDDIKTCAKAFKAKVIDRPKELATDESTTVDVLKHAVNYLNNEKIEFDTIVLLQPTSPLRLPGDISAALEEYEKCCGKYMSSVYISRFIEHTSESGSLINSRRQTIHPRIIEHGMLYIYDECYEPIGMGRIDKEQILTNPTSRWQSYEIDDLEDAEICEFYMRKKVLCTS